MEGVKKKRWKHEINKNETAEQTVKLHSKDDFATTHFTCAEEWIFYMHRYTRRNLNIFRGHFAHTVCIETVRTELLEQSLFFGAEWRKVWNANFLKHTKDSLFQYSIGVPFVYGILCKFSFFYWQVHIGFWVQFFVSFQILFFRIEFAEYFFFFLVDVNLNFSCILFDWATVMCTT